MYLCGYGTGNGVNLQERQRLHRKRKKLKYG